MNSIFRAVLLAPFFLSALSGHCLAGTQITTEWNLYSPNLIHTNDLYVMYAGGWGNDQKLAFANSGTLPHDSIYRSVCTTETTCTTPQIVIRPQDSGLGLLNDPSVVDTGRGYLIMYMTGVANSDPNAGYTVANNQIYFSTSWATDGVNWSAPQLLLPGAWLPSATVGPSGNIMLYANSNVNGQLYMYDLGASGVAPPSPQFVKFFDANGHETNAYYVNVDIAWMPQIAMYQMLGQTSDMSRIDFLYSLDGINFRLSIPGVVTTHDAVNAPIVTPTHWPDSFCHVYYGQGDNGLLSFNIAWHPWC